MEKEAIIREVTKIIRSYLDEEYALFLFGSWAKGDARPTSDLDIGVLGKTKVPWEIMVKIRHSIEGIPTLRSIDIVDLNATENSFKETALKHAQLLDMTHG